MNETIETNKTQTLHFVITGEFVTNFARTRFWDENCDYETAEDILLSCLITDQLTLEERKNIARDILEGKLKITGDSSAGINVEDDGEHIRPLTLKIKEAENKLALMKIREDMRIYPERYVDPYSTIKSNPDATDEIERIVSRYSCSRPEATLLYFAVRTDSLDRYVDFTNYYPAYNTPTQAGLWLQDPDLILKLNGGPITYNDRLVGSKFWQNVYDYVKEDEAFITRNLMYDAALRKQANDGYNYVNLEKDIPKENPWFKGYDQIKTPDQMPNLETSTLEEINAYFIKDGDPIDNTVFPTPIDEATDITGVIAPNGDFYQCSFGSHALKAHNLIIAHRELLNKDHKYIPFDQTLDHIIKHGYIAINYRPNRGTYLTTIRDVDRSQAKTNTTKAQINTICDLIIQLDDVAPAGLSELIEESEG